MAHKVRTVNAVEVDGEEINEQLKYILIFLPQI